VRDVVALDAERQRFEIERLAQLFECLDTPRPLLVGGRLLRDERVARVLVGELLEPALLAALRAPYLDPRPALVRQELRESGEVSRVARNDDLGRDARNRSAARALQNLTYRSSSIQFACHSHWIEKPRISWD